MNRLNLPDDVPIEAGMVTKAIRSAQTQVEQQNFEIRKNVLKYDEVLNKQRTVIYDERRRVLDGEDIHEQIEHMIGDVVDRLRRRRDRRGLRRGLGPRQAVDGAGHAVPGRRRTAQELADERRRRPHPRDARRGRARRRPAGPTRAREAEIDAVIGAQGGMRELERQVLLQVMDRKWREHLYEMDYLKEGIGLRAMAQRDPLIEYQREGFDMFTAMLEGIKEETVGHLFNVRVQAAAPPAAPEPEADGEAASPVERTSPTRAVAPAAAPAAPAAPVTPEAERTTRVPARSGNSARAGTRRPRATRRRPRACCPRCWRGPRTAELQYSGPAEDGGTSRSRSGRAAAARPVPARRAGAQPAVPVRFGPQVQAVPRDADGRPALIATGQRSRSVTHRHRRGSSGSAAGTRSKRAASARARDPRR